MIWYKEVEDSDGRAKYQMLEIDEGRVLCGVRGGDKAGFGW